VGALAPDPLARDLLPSTYERLCLERLSRFEVERVRAEQVRNTPSVYLRGRVAIYRATARENPEDVRLLAYAEVTHLRRGRGRPLTIPQVDRVFYEATRALHAVISELDPHRRLQWNRFVVRLLPAVPLGVEVIKGYVSRLSPAARWVGLEKVVVQARFADHAAPGGVTPLMDLSIGDLLQPQPSYALRAASRQPLTPRSRFESSVVAARRRGLIHPSEVLYLLEGGGTLPRGRVQPLPGLPPEVAEGAGAALGVWLVETPHTRPRVTFRRVLIISNPTLRMGALAAPECALIIAALDFAAAQRLPVEWVSVSSGARIDWESGTENLDACARVLRRLIEFNRAGGQVNVLVPGVCVGAQSYWNAEATMMMNASGVLIMTDRGAMVLTGKRALELSGCVAAQDELDLGGYSSVMGPNGQAQLYAPDLPRAYALLYTYYQLCYLEPGARRPAPLRTRDTADRDIGRSPYPEELGHGFRTVGEVFSELNAERKRPFSVRPIMHALLDEGAPTLERWGATQGAETAVVWHGRLAGHALTLIGVENQPTRRVGGGAEGPSEWAGGTLYPQASRKVARALNASRGRCPVAVLANLSGFDGSPESLRQWQLEYGAEIARAVEGFDGPIYFIVLSRYHGGAYVVFSKALNPRLEALAVEGSYASVIGGGPAAVVVFGRDVSARAAALAREEARAAGLDEREARVSAEHEARARAEVAQRFDATHSVHRAARVGSIDEVIPLSALRPALAARLAADAAGAAGAAGAAEG